MPMITSVFGDYLVLIALIISFSKVWNWHNLAIFSDLL